MDYNLAALKLLCQQLKEAKQIPSQPSFTYNGILFQRAWLQGILIDAQSDSDSDSDFNSQYPRFFLDDGTGLIELLFTADFLNQNNWSTGMYVMVVGGYLIRDGEIPYIKVHKIVDLSAHPNREVMWYLEVIEAYRMFYQTSIED